MDEHSGRERRQPDAAARAVINGWQRVCQIQSRTIAQLRRDKMRLLEALVEARRR